MCLDLTKSCARTGISRYACFPPRLPIYFNPLTLSPLASASTFSHRMFSIPNAARTSSKPPWHIAFHRGRRAVACHPTRPTFPIDPAVELQCGSLLAIVAKFCRSKLIGQQPRAEAASASSCGAVTAAPHFPTRQTRCEPSTTTPSSPSEYIKKHTCMSTGSPVYSGENASKSIRSPSLHGNTCSTPSALRH